MDKKTEKLIVIITGGAGGVGKFLAREFYKLGHIVNVIDVQDTGEEKNINYYYGDVTSQGDVKKIFSNIFNKHGRIDVLINNAGKKYFSLVKKMSLGDVENAIDINLKALYITTREALPYMEKGHFGRIINISSNAGLRGYERSSVYSATKAGINLFTESVAKEVPKSITVNCICPSTISTEEFIKMHPATNHDALIDPQVIFKMINKIINSDINGEIIPVMRQRTFLSYLLYEIKRLMRMFRYQILWKR